MTMEIPISIIAKRLIGFRTCTGLRESRDTCTVASNGGVREKFEEPIGKPDLSWEKPRKTSVSDEDVHLNQSLTSIDL